MDGDPSLVFGTACGNQTGVNAEDAGNVRNTVVGVTIGLLKVKVNVLGDLGGIIICKTSRTALVELDKLCRRSMTITFGFSSVTVSSLYTTSFGPLDGYSTGAELTRSLLGDSLKGRRKQLPNGRVELCPLLLVSNHL